MREIQSGSELGRSSSFETSLYTKEKLAMHFGFFDRLINEFALKKLDADIIAVLHLLPDAEPLTYAMNKIADIRAVIPKPKSINSEVMMALGGINFLHLDRENISQAIDLVGRKTVFMDIGGYFSGITNELNRVVGSNFCGVVEDTENGFQKYLIRVPDFPFISVARSPLKDNEDIMVGQAIAYSAEAVLRQHGILFNGLQVGVFGFGKIGRSVAQNVSQKQARVTVNDLDAVRMTHAVSSGFDVLDRMSLIEKMDCICLATGHKSLIGDDYVRLKNGCWLFSVTSSDDELDKLWLEENYDKEQVSRFVTKYSRGGHFFYMLNEGNAINFIHGTTVGDFILLVHAELLVAAYALMTDQVIVGEYELDRRTRSKICEIWLSHFKFGRK